MLGTTEKLAGSALLHSPYMKNCILGPCHISGVDVISIAHVSMDWIAGCSIRERILMERTIMGEAEHPSSVLEFL